LHFISIYFKMKINIKDFLLVLTNEIKHGLRDKNTIIYIFIIPIMLYPLLFWGVNQVFLLQMGSVEKQNSRLHFLQGEDYPLLYNLLEEKEKLDILEVDNPSKALENKKIDAILIIIPPTIDDDSTYIEIDYDKANDRSRAARKRIKEVIGEYKNLLLKEAAKKEGLPPELTEAYKIKEENIAPPKKMGGFLLGAILPFIMVIMTALGSFYPAIDVTAGERERGTLETLLLIPTNRLNIILGKYAFVCIASFTAVSLNLISMVITAKHTLFLIREEKDALFVIPFKALPLVIIGCILLSAFFSAVMMLLASFARNYREAESYVTPFYILSFQPALLAAVPGFKLNWLTVWLPVGNVALMFKETMLGTFRWHFIIIIILNLICYVLITLFISSKLLGKEDMIFKEKEGSFTKKKKKKLLRKIRGIK